MYGPVHTSNNCCLRIALACISVYQALMCLYILTNRNGSGLKVTSMYLICPLFGLISGGVCLPMVLEQTTSKIEKLKNDVFVELRQTLLCVFALL